MYPASQLQGVTPNIWYLILNYFYDIRFSNVIKPHRHKYNVLIKNELSKTCMYIQKDRKQCEIVQIIIATVCHIEKHSLKQRVVLHEQSDYISGQTFCHTGDKRKVFLPCVSTCDVSVQQVHVLSIHTGHNCRDFLELLAA